MIFLAFPALPNVVKLLLTYAAPGVAELLTRLWFQGTQQGTNTSLNTACQTIANSWATNMAPNTVPALALTSVQAEDLTNPSGPNGIWTGSKAGSFTGTTTTAPQAAFIIKNVVQDRYRGGHSRLYLPGMPLADSTTNDATTWTTAFGSAVATSWTSFLGNILSALGTAGYGSVAACVPQIYRGHTWTHYGTPPDDYYKYKATYNPTTPPPTPTYNAVSYNDVIGTQRRRTHQTG